MNKTLNKINALNKRNPATISQWLRYRAEYIELKKQLPPEITCLDFTLGQLMPVCGPIDHLCPAGKSYLFTAKNCRFPGIIDQNNVSIYKYGKGWRTQTSAKHEVRVVSVAVFVGRKLEWLRGPSDVVKKFILPPGWTWQKDELGIKVVNAEGVDYHPFWTAEITVENILEGHAQNKTRRIEQLRAESFRQLAINSAATTYVLLEDSRRAGNCVEGSLNFASQRLGLSREDILAAPHLIKVSGAALLRTHDNRAENAVVQAFMRETTISI